MTQVLFSKMSGIISLAFIDVVPSDDAEFFNPFSTVMLFSYSFWLLLGGFYTSPENHLVIKAVQKLAINHLRDIYPY